MKKTEVLCVGETMVMVTPDDASPLRLAPACQLRPGGAESNVATHLSGLGHSVEWAGALGVDALGDLIEDQLAHAGVGVSLVTRDPQRRTAVYFKDPSPEGTGVIYYRDGSAASAMSPSAIGNWAQQAPNIVHTSGITAALSGSCADLMRAIVEKRSLSPALISFDVNYRPSLWSDPEQAAEVLLSLARASDIVFVGRDEAETLWGTPRAEDIRALLPEVSHLVVKDSSEEALEYTVNGVVSCEAPWVDVVEPVGAGDAFAAGWLYGKLRGHTTTERLRMGHLVASRVLLSPSDAAPPPTSDQIARALALTPSLWETTAKKIGT